MTEEREKKAGLAIKENRPGDAAIEYEELGREFLGADDSRATYDLFLAAQYALPEKAAQLYREVHGVYLRLRHPGKCAAASLTLATVYEKQEQLKLAADAYRECIAFSANTIRDVVDTGDGCLGKEQDVELADHLDRIHHCRKQLQESIAP